MRRRGGAGALVAALALVGGARAQSDQAGRGADDLGVVQGRITAIDRESAVVRLESLGETVALRASPDQLGEAPPGSFVSASYRRYGEQRWLTDSLFSGAGVGGAGRGAVDGFGEVGCAEGAVEAFDLPAGEVRVGGIAYSAHPAEIEGLTIGQRVRFGFRSVGQTRWVAPGGCPGDQAGGTAR
jgi:hypothetical protein